MNAPRVSLRIVGLILVTTIPVAADQSSKNSGMSLLHCHLTLERISEVAESVFPGVLELRNDSMDPISAEYWDDPTDHLVLDIWDPTGKLLRKTCPYYGCV
jgi:hypothetical protein